MLSWNGAKSDWSRLSLRHIHFGASVPPAVNATSDKTTFPLFTPYLRNAHQLFILDKLTLFYSQRFALSNALGFIKFSRVFISLSNRKCDFLYPLSMLSGTLKPRLG